MSDTTERSDPVGLRVVAAGSGMAPGARLSRRNLLLGLSTITLGGPLLAACGGGGGGGAAAAPTPVTPAPAPDVTPTAASNFSAAGFTTTDQNRFGFATTDSSRDQEVTTWTTNGRVFLRITPAGRALFFEVRNNTLTIGIAIGLSELTYYPTDYRVLMQGPMPTSGASSPSFTFGVQGFDIYAKLDGAEFLRFQDFHHVQVGRIGLKQPNGASFGPITGTHFQDKSLFSNLATQTYDARDFGFRSVRAQGSISAGSSTLTLTAAADYRVGDWVIVEIGQEAGAGRRGTVGVGGVWPSTSYPNGAAMNADTSRPTNTFAWRADTGDVYRWSGTAWDQQTRYYVAKAVPRSLHARVIAVSGNSLTLDTAATVSATNANVYLDVVPILNFLTQHYWYKFGNQGELQSLVPVDRSIVIPAGDFAVCGMVLLNRGGMSNTLRGAGKDATILRAPKGVAVPTIHSHRVDNTSPKTMVSDLHLLGNARDEGYGLNWQESAIPLGVGPAGMEWDKTSALPPVTDTDIAYAVGYGIFSDRSRNADVRDVNVTDVFKAAVGAGYSTDCSAYNVSVRMTDGLQTYVQWMIQWSDCTGGAIVDCAVESSQLIEGMETFQSRGVQFIRPRFVNASFSSNSSGDFLVQDADVLIQAMSHAPGQSFSQNNPVFNINANMGTNSLLPLGGRLIGCRVLQEGYINTSNDNLVVVGVAAQCPNVTISGGRFSAPDYLAGTSRFGSVGVGSQGSNTVVDGLTIIGKSQFDVTGQGLRNINVVNGSVTNCICNSISAPGY